MNRPLKPYRDLIVLDYVSMKRRTMFISYGKADVPERELNYDEKTPRKTKSSDLRRFEFFSVAVR